MSLVTYIPRLIPFVIMDKLKLSKGAKKILEYIPYAALGALVFPSGFTAISTDHRASFIGIIVAIIMSLFTQNILSIVIITILISCGALIL